jgi:sugar lactone lactonase YvrE
MPDLLKRSAFVLACAVLAPASSLAATATASAKPPLETVASFGDDFDLVGLGVSHSGRLFVTAPASVKRSIYSVGEVDPRSGNLTPYPDAAWNRFDPQADGAHQWISVQALWDDGNDHLWALDSSLPKLDQTRLPPKLVEFDLGSNKVMREYSFEGTVTPKDSLNDLRIDLKHGYAYLTNAAHDGGLVVLDLHSGRSRMLLAGDRSSIADPQQHLMFGTHVARGLDGKVFVMQSDGIALSPDATWLYYRPLTDHHYWRIPTAALRDPALSAADLVKTRQYLGDHVLSGGMIMAPDGVLYTGNLEGHSVVSLTPTTDRHGKPGLTQHVLVEDPARLSWADGFAIHDGYLYIADSHLSEVHFANDLPRSGRFTLFRIPLSQRP